MKKFLKIILPITSLIILIMFAFYFTKLSSTQNINSSTNSQSNETKNSPPDFALNDLEGNKVSLSDYKGKIIFLNFWATWCGPCKAEIPELEKANKNLDPNEAVLLTVNLTDGIRETPNIVTEFVKINKLKFKVLLDEETKIADLYNVNLIPTTFIINKKFEIVNKKESGLSEKTINQYVKDLK